MRTCLVSLLVSVLGLASCESNRLDRQEPTSTESSPDPGATPSAAPANTQATEVSPKRLDEAVGKPPKPSLRSRYNHLQTVLTNFTPSARMPSKCLEMLVGDNDYVFMVSGRFVEAVRKGELDYAKISKLPRLPEVASTAVPFVEYVETQVPKTAAQSLTRSQLATRQAAKDEVRWLRDHWNRASRYALVSWWTDRTYAKIVQRSSATKSQGGKIVQEGSAGLYTPGNMTGWAMVIDLDEAKILCGKQVEASNQSKIRYTTGDAEGVERKLRKSLYSAFTLACRKAWRAIAPDLDEAARVKPRSLKLPKGVTPGLSKEDIQKLIKERMKTN